jgi:hypothetical protein
MAKVKGHRFDALDRPIPSRASHPGTFEAEAEEQDDVLEQTVETHKTGKFF